MDYAELSLDGGKLVITNDSVTSAGIWDPPNYHRRRFVFAREVLSALNIRKEAD